MAYINPNLLTPEEKQKEMERLKESYSMYEMSKKQTIDRRTNAKDKNGNPIYSPNSIPSTLEVLNTMEDDIITEYQMLGGTKEELDEYATAKMESESTKNIAYDFDEKTGQLSSRPQSEINVSPELVEYLANMDRLQSGYTIHKEDERKNYESNKKVNEEKEIKSFTKENKFQQVNNSAKSFDPSKVKQQFDLIPLPSKGEAYATKQNKISVAYLTAYDENMILSPNLYQDNSFLDYLLKAKVLDPSIDVEDLLPGDRDAIILWLRATSYGSDFPCTVTDEETGRDFETVIDLSKIKYKDFDLKGDENGWFEYTLPVSNDVVKFSFLTQRQINAANKMDEQDNNSIRKAELEKINERLIEYRQNDNVISKNFAKRVDDAILTIEDWYNTLETEGRTLISHTLTNRLIMSIKSINGNTDERFIQEYVLNMNIKDSSSLRKYITENEPGLNFNIEVKRPKSLGGGSIKTFLQFNQYIFLNIA